MSPAIAKADEGGGVVEHFEDVVLIGVRIVEHGDEEHRAAVTLKHEVVEEF